MKDKLSDFMPPAEYAAVWRRVQFVKQSSVCWIEIITESNDGTGDRIHTDGDRDSSPVCPDSDDMES